MVFCARAAAMATCSAPPAWLDSNGPPWVQPYWAERLEPLDAGDAGLAYVVPDFLSAAETSHILRRAQSLAHGESKPYVSMVLGSRGDDGLVDPTLEAIEARIANLTGVPAGDVPRVSLNRPWGAEHAASRLALQNLHHDQNQRPRRALTVLIYLSGGEDEGGHEEVLQGGETLFPCVTARAQAEDGATERDAGISGTILGRMELCERLERAYHARRLALTMPNGIFKTPSFDPQAALAASELCRSPSGSGGDAAQVALRVAPRRGSALLFRYVRLDAPSHALPRMWHGGCRVVSGEKWTYQMFKELPEGS